MSILKAVRDHKKNATMVHVVEDAEKPAPKPRTTPPKPKIVHKPRKKKREFKKGRLPHDSRFDVTYDSPTQTWRGILVIGNGPEFYAEGCQTVFGMLMHLDNIYRTWLEAQPVPAGQDEVQEDGLSTKPAAGRPVVTTLSRNARTTN